MAWKVKERKALARQGLAWNDMEMKGKARNKKFRFVPTVLLKMKNRRDETQSVVWEILFLKSKLNKFEV